MLLLRADCHYSFLPALHQDKQLALQHTDKEGDVNLPDSPLRLLDFGNGRRAEFITSLDLLESVGQLKGVKWLRKKRVHTILTTAPTP